MPDTGSAPLHAPKGQLRFRDRDPKKIGVLGLVGCVALMGLSLNYDRIPVVNGKKNAVAYVADAAGLHTGDSVQVAGIKVGNVRDISLDGDKVRIDFVVDRDVRMGADTSAKIKTDSILGRRALAVYSDGRGDLPDDTIPVERTSVPYSLTSALGDLSDTVEELDTQKVDEALRVISETMEKASPEVKGTLDGLTRLSQSLNKRDEALLDLLHKAAGATDVLGTRSEQINTLVVDGNTLFTELDLRRRAISELIVNIDSLSRQLSGLVQDNEETLGPALDKLARVSELLLRNKDDIDLGLRRIAPFATALGEAVASGPWFNAYISNLSIGQYPQSLVHDLLPLINDEVPPQPPLQREPTMPGVPELKLQDQHPRWGQERFGQ